MLIATVVARNYLAQARVLARSFRAHHPDGRVVALVLDAPGEGLRDDEPFEVMTPDRLPLPTAELHRMAAIYDVMELATALKPSLLRHLVVDRGEDAVTYLDPDIEVLAPLDDVAGLARRHGIVLTPHRLEPMPEDGRGPVEHTFVQAGAYNLGFVAVSAAATPFLDWWDGRCRRECVRSFPDGYFVDQRWVDLGVTYADHHLLRDRGCNVAYWNLDTRPVSEDASGFLAGGVPLRFFHFSAYDPDDPHLLSRHQGERPRVLLSEHPALRRLCDRYAARLVAEGWPECRKLAYGFDEAANGLRLDLTMRRVFRQEVLRREQGIGHGLGHVDDLPDPFDPGGADDFVALLRSPFPDSEHPRVSRYVHALYVARPDLQRSFPDLSGLAGNHFLWWLREMGAPTLGVPGELVPTEDEIRRGSTPPGGVDDDAAHPVAPRDVRVVGYLAAELGIGESGRALVAGVEAAGERVAVLSERATANRQQHDEPALAGGVAGGDGGTFGGDIDIVCVNADRLPAVLDRLTVGPGRRAYTVGMWSWEVEHFPPLHARAAGLVDEVWACSGWAADAIRRAVVDTPVHAVPNPVVERPPRPRSRAQLGLPDGFVFLFCFDFFSVAERKNPLGVLEAFRRAFTPGEGPQLVLKSINGPVVLSELERLRVAACDRPDVRLVDGYLDAEDQRALVAGCDAYVSLHRAEGFGYTMAEAMLLAKPVIATGYSGNLEFMDERNSFLVGHEMVAIPDGCEPYPAGGAWADPDVDEAAAAMRHLVGDPAGARAVGRRARDDIRRFHSPAARAPLVAARLAASRAALADRRVARARARPSPLVRAGRRAARGALGALRRAAG